MASKESTMQSHELRRRYLGFFAERGHKVLPSSPLVPNDPTLLFTAAGMVQFKDYFWGRREPAFRRATTCQKCFRTTDIEEVGRTAFHHTFFEMLGNFSFGDYFKQGAIELAWEFLTRELGIPGERFAITVYEEDDEAYAIWRDVVGVPPERIVRLGKEHNWWGPVGDSGPCGPDSELHYDTGKENACGPNCKGPACDCDRYAEIWNLVFMQYDAQPGGSFAPLAQKNIDTGMGLERATAVLQGAATNFDTDAFRALVEAIAAKAGHRLGKKDLRDRNTVADHVRGTLFLVADGVMPGNERQGYVLRRILRRAIRAGGRLELAPGSLGSLVDPVIESLGGVYPEIVGARDVAVRLIDREEDVFGKTLRDGERRLDKIASELARSGDKTLPGELAFELTDTYGFPLEMTEEILAEKGISVDHAGFDSALEAQRTRSRVQVSASMSAEAEVTEAGKTATEFTGYDTGSDGAGRKPLVAEVELENVIESSVGAGERLIFPSTPFYAASGGQVADMGTIRNLSREGEARVLDVVKNARGVFLHRVEILGGSFRPDDRCRLIVDEVRRRRIERNHTATHLLHAGLRTVLGPHAQQAGSEVTDRELRFDFSHFAKMTPQEIAQVEDFANAAALADHVVTTDLVTRDEARERGAMGLFEDEYRGHDKVRLVQVDDVSRELCGGTHVRRTGEIGLIRIVSEESVASGVRRIRAVTGDASLAVLRDEHARIERLRAALGDDPEVGIEKLRQRAFALEKEVESLTAREVTAQGESLVSNAEAIGGARLVAARADLAADAVKSLADELEGRAQPAVVVLVGASGGRATAVCKASKSVKGVDAGAIVRAMSKTLGGGGGGSRGFAQGGGPDVGRADEALAEGRRLAGDAMRAGGA
jgi:alanyl-tRNA synthetase